MSDESKHSMSESIPSSAAEENERSTRVKRTPRRPRPCADCRRDQSGRMVLCTHSKGKKVTCPRVLQGTGIHFTPSLKTRQKYLDHCSDFSREPKRLLEEEEREVRRRRREALSLYGEGGGGKRRKSSGRPENEDYMSPDFNDVDPTIRLPVPQPRIHHTKSDQIMLKVPSPKISGEVIPALKNLVAPEEVVPPIPPKSEYGLHKPHSGIIINKTADYVPETYNFPDRAFERRPFKCTRRGLRRRRKPRTVTICPRTCPNWIKNRSQMSRSVPPRKTVRVGKSSVPPACRVLPKKKRKRRKKYQDDCNVDIPKHLKSGMFKTHSLTVVPCMKERKPQTRYGILTGTFNMYDQKFGPRSRGRQAVTMSVMAYCLAFHYHPKQWTTRLIDTLIDAGDTWYLDCADKIHDHSAVQGVCEVLPYGKKQSLNLNKKKMQVLLGEPDVVGYTMSTDPTVYNLCRGLTAFFKENRACIFMTRVLKVVVWKDKVCYYIFDPAGRDSKAISNYTTGCAALMNVSICDLDGVVQILMARSPVEDQKFILAPLKVLKMLDENADEDIDSEAELTQAEKAMMSYRILNENCAIVNATMHLGDRCFEETKYRQALTIAVVAMTYAKISPSNTWYTKTLDKILRLGNQLYSDIAHPKRVCDITIDNIPNQFQLGPYCCEVIIYRERVKGLLFTPKECLFNIQTGLKEFFNYECTSAIIEFNNYTLSVWKQKDMFYLFDPYPRSVDGLRAIQDGKACVMMLLNVDSVAEAFIANWNYLPLSTQFYIHGFKVLKLKKKSNEMKIVCTLSEEELPSSRLVKKQLAESKKGHGDCQEICHITTVDCKDGDAEKLGTNDKCLIDEERMGDLISLVDSIQDGYVPPIPMKYKHLPPEELEPKVVNLDSPTVSATQVIPPWPKPRDKSDELPEPDPDPEPTPPPTPPPAEGGAEEAEEEEDAEDEEGAKKDKGPPVDILPPPIPPPPPTPQSEPELATGYSGGGGGSCGGEEGTGGDGGEQEVQLLYQTKCEEKLMDREIEVLEPVEVKRTILLTEDAKLRYHLRQLRKKGAPPIIELPQMERSPSEELKQPNNFQDLLDFTQIIRGKEYLKNTEIQYVMPFTAIVALVMSYKYSINTWTKGIVDFVVDTSRKLFEKRLARFQFTPIHVLPRLAIGSQAYQVKIDVVGEGTTWKLEYQLMKDFFPKYDRGMITTYSYSAAFFRKNGLYYLYDASPCNVMGFRNVTDDGAACFMRFQTLHDLAGRICANHFVTAREDSNKEQHYILSRVVVTLLQHEPRLKLPDDYSYATGRPKSLKSKTIVVAPGPDKVYDKIDPALEDDDDETGYQRYESMFIIEGSTYLEDRKPGDKLKPSHFCSIVAMLLMTMRPLDTWSPIVVDICIEKGLEIFTQAKNLTVCEKRCVKNIILDGNVLSLNIKRIQIMNENKDMYLDHYLMAVVKRMRFFVIGFRGSNFVVARARGYYHVFDPNKSPAKGNVDDEMDDLLKNFNEDEKERANQGYVVTEDILLARRRDRQTDLASFHKKNRGKRTGTVNACWSLYRSLDAVFCKIRSVVPTNEIDSPVFYTFELVSVNRATRNAAFLSKLSPLYRSDVNPNAPFLKRHSAGQRADERLYWLDIDTVPWSRIMCENGLGIRRNTFRSLWYEWDIEFPGDLYSLWGTLHPRSMRFPEANRGKQYLATCAVALAFTTVCKLRYWTSRLIDGIVDAGDKYHEQCLKSLGKKANVEIALTDLPSNFDDVCPYNMQTKFTEVIFGFFYNTLPDRFNLSNALTYFFEKNDRGMLICPTKNLAFGKMGHSYFMFDCTSYGLPLFAPGQGSAYMLKCESLNRLVYCMIITMNVKSHGVQFNLYSVDAIMASAKPTKKTSSTSVSSGGSESAKSISAKSPSAKSTSGKTPSLATPSIESPSKSTKSSSKSSGKR